MPAGMKRRAEFNSPDVEAAACTRKYSRATETTPSACGVREVRVEQHCGAATMLAAPASTLDNACCPASLHDILTPSMGLLHSRAAAGSEGNDATPAAGDTAASTVRGYR